MADTPADRTQEERAPNDDAPGEAPPTGADEEAPGPAQGSASDAATREPPTPLRGETPKEVVMSIIVSFAVVFIFTRFVFASYVIPTGSMAPTLMGAHIRVHSDETGLDWAVNPHRYLDRGASVPARTQERVKVTDPVTGRDILIPRTRLHKGDHIFVQHYLYTIVPPKRWDVVVFKYPGRLNENYIKRLVGLPGEQIMLADGDVFTRPVNDAGEASGDWTIQRKPDYVQEGLWYTLFSSERTPLDETIDGRRWRQRWISSGPVERDGGAYRIDEGRVPGELAWSWGAAPIDDWVAYNDTPRASGVRRFPVADLRLRTSVTPEQEGVRLAAAIRVRGFVFEAIVADDRAELVMRSGEESQRDADARTLASAQIAPLPVGEATPIAFVHADQRLQLWIDGEKVLEGAYDWGPVERLARVLAGEVDEREMPAFIGRPERYTRPDVSLAIDAAPATLQRVGLDRDVYYQPVPPSGAGRAAAPHDPTTLRANEFFVLGDNSAASGDGRVWETLDPWVIGELDSPAGVVPRELLMGKAFFVFWPAPKRLFGLPIVPDFGRMRFIR